MKTQVGKYYTDKYSKKKNKLLSRHNSGLSCQEVKFR